MGRICVGEVVKPQGIKGEIKVKPFSDDLDNLSGQDELYLNGKRYGVKAARADKGMIFYALEGVDRNIAEQLRGAKVEVDEECAAELEDGEYYIKDLIGCEVFAGSVSVGKVTDIDSYGAADVYTVIDNSALPDGGKAKVVRFPFLRRIIVSVDIKLKKIVLDAQGFEEVSVYED